MSWPIPCIRLSNAELGPFHHPTDDNEEGEGERNGLAGGATLAPEGSAGPGTRGRHWAEASEMLDGVLSRLNAKRGSQDVQWASGVSSWGRALTIQ